MKRADLTEKILDIKREKAWTWKHITDEIGGMSPVLVIGALLGQMKLAKPLAKAAAELFGLTEMEGRMLNEEPYRGTPMPPTDPLIYRFYEMVMVNGPAWKALIEEEFTRPRGRPLGAFASLCRGRKPVPTPAASSMTGQRRARGGVSRSAMPEAPLLGPPRHCSIALLAKISSSCISRGVSPCSCE
jgi:cyanate lyase